MLLWNGYKHCSARSIGGSGAMLSGAGATLLRRDQGRRRVRFRARLGGDRRSSPAAAPSVLCSRRAASRRALSSAGHGAAARATTGLAAKPGCRPAYARRARSRRLARGRGNRRRLAGFPPSVEESTAADFSLYRDVLRDDPSTRALNDEAFHVSYTLSQLARVAPRRQWRLLWGARLEGLSAAGDRARERPERYHLDDTVIHLAAALRSCCQTRRAARAARLDDDLAGARRLA
jgi:hypothetical protein